MEIDNKDWFISLVDECRDIIVETEFASKDSLIQGRHQLGQRILQSKADFEREGIDDTGLVQHVAQSCKKSKRTIYYAIKFYQKFPDLALLPAGKHESWHHIINKYLTEGEEKTKKLTPTEIIKAIKTLIETELQKELQSVNNGEIAINKSNVSFIRYLQDQINKITP
jgi:hypothetical protein